MIGIIVNNYQLINKYNNKSTLILPNSRRCAYSYKSGKLLDRSYHLFEGNLCHNRIEIFFYINSERIYASWHATIIDQQLNHLDDLVPYVVSGDKAQALMHIFCTKYMVVLSLKGMTRSNKKKAIDLKC